MNYQSRVSVMTFLLLTIILLWLNWSASAQSSSHTVLIFFSNESSKFDQRFEVDVEEVYCHAIRNPDLRLAIQGLADPRGSAKENMALSQQRAISVATMLARYGMSCDRPTEISGRGEEGSGDEARPLSRRVDIILSGSLASKDVVEACRKTISLHPPPGSPCKLKVPSISERKN